MTESHSTLPTHPPRLYRSPFHSAFLRLEIRMDFTDPQRSQRTEMPAETLLAALAHFLRAPPSVSPCLRTGKRGLREDGVRFS